MQQRVSSSRAGSQRPRAGGRLFLAASVQLALTDGVNETWIQISKTGSWKGHSWGEFDLTLEHFESAIAQFGKATNDLVIDYEHASLSFIPTEAPAAGWITELRIEGDSLSAYAKFNDRAAAYIRSGEYRYFSPVWLFDSPDRESGEEVPAELHSVALTNVPFFDGMAPVELTRLRALTNGDTMPPKKTRQPAKPVTATREEEEQAMEGATPAGEQALAMLMSILGVESEEALGAWVKEHEEALRKMASGEAAGEEPDGSPGEPAAGTHAPALTLALSRIERLEQELARFKGAEIEGLVDAAISAGRATPNERDALLELGRTNRTLFDKLTASRTVVPTTPVTTPSAPLPATKGGKGGKGAPTKAAQSAEVEQLSPPAQFAYRNWRAAGKGHDEALSLSRETEDPQA